MYERARYLIVSEIAQINGLPEGEVETEVEKALDRAILKRRPVAAASGTAATTEVPGGNPEPGSPFPPKN